MNTARPEAATKQPRDLGSASIRMTRVSGVTGPQAVTVRCDSILIRTEEGRRTTGNTERLSRGVAPKRTPGHQLTYRHRVDPDANPLSRSVHAVVPGLRSRRQMYARACSPPGDGEFES